MQSKKIWARKLVKTERKMLKTKTRIDNSKTKTTLLGGGAERLEEKGRKEAQTGQR